MKKNIKSEEELIRETTQETINLILDIFRIKDVTPHMAVFCLDTLAKHLRGKNPDIPMEFPIEAEIK
mgnify:CR=1 FL=1